MHYGFSFCILLVSATLSRSYSTGRQPEGILARSQDDLAILESRGWGLSSYKSPKSKADSSAASPFDGPRLMRSPRLSRQRLQRRGCTSSKGCRTNSPDRPSRQQQRQSPPPERSRSNSPLSSLSLRRSASFSSVSNPFLVSAADISFGALARDSPSWDQRRIRAGLVQPGQPAGASTPRLPQHGSGSRADNSGQTVNSGAISLPSRSSP